MKTATFIKKLKGWRGDARLYKLSEPMEYGMIGKDGDYKTEWVIVSAVIVPFSGAETYIFPSDEDGNAINYLEINGSYRGGLSHETALQNAGYII